MQTARGLLLTYDVPRGLWILRIPVSTMAIQNGVPSQSAKGRKDGMQLGQALIGEGPNTRSARNRDTIWPIAD